MKKNGERGPTARAGDADDDRIVTPDREPSALERGARIIERLRRKSSGMPKSN